MGLYSWVALMLVLTLVTLSARPQSRTDSPVLADDDIHRVLVQRVGDDDGNTGIVVGNH